MFINIPKTVFIMNFYFMCKYFSGFNYEPSNDLFQSVLSPYRGTQIFSLYAIKIIVNGALLK